MIGGVPSLEIPAIAEHAETRTPLKVALDALRCGISVVPPREDGTKRPAFDTWKAYQARRPTEEEVRGWYATPRSGVGVVGGAVSDCVLLFEFDEHRVYEEFKARAHAAGLRELVEKCEAGYLEQTPNGFHWLLRCETCATTKLAKRRRSEEEKRNPHDRWKTIIETKGEGGFAIVAPSNGRVHPSGRPYVLQRGGFGSIFYITPEELEELFAVARTFDQTPEREERSEEARTAESAGGRPGDDFNARVSWADVLLPHGWTRVYERGEVIAWCRPGKQHGISATTGYAGSDLLYVFSTSTPFEAERGYSKFSAYAVLEHEGDFAAAARELARQGYGERADRAHVHDLNGAEAERDAEGPEPLLIRLHDVESERVEWLWTGRMPRGKVVVLDGDPGLGKSTLALDLAARVSSGRPMPDGAPSVRGGVVICSAEDGLADTIRPRLDAARADPARIVAFEGVRAADGTRAPLTLPEDVVHLEWAIREVGAVLVIIDPLMAFLSGETNAHRDQHVRRALAPVAGIAEATGACVLLIRHLNKGGGANAIHRGGGSIGIIGAARAGLLVARDPEDEERRVLAVSKSNLAREAPALGYRLVGTESGAAALDWLGATEHRGEDLLEVPGDRAERSKLDEAKDFLRAELANGPRPVKELQGEARDAGIGWRTVETAKARLGVRPDKQTFAGGRWVWSLPARRDSAEGRTEDRNAP